MSSGTDRLKIAVHGYPSVTYIRGSRVKLEVRATRDGKPVLKPGTLYHCCAIWGPVDHENSQLLDRQYIYTCTPAHADRDGTITIEINHDLILNWAFKTAECGYPTNFNLLEFCMYVVVFKEGTTGWSTREKRDDDQNLWFKSPSSPLFKIRDAAIVTPAMGSTGRSILSPKGGTL
ncbi:hypothetical protein BGW36DRAFT_453742 [Talaromyces proteolyticus]|uniref:Uncharacterized protein n=1 Tax=Talaromyces proteolyticus TaxID=1131652 RepID=A0AAD4PYY2_9EURO|nr:uncharacterized protein BGW36DRAFT_453742 [Talaromyces proteolyticus]KAH8695653.1 hypothetical protein BGW36DRAFT_453742 [Talaromyces proteolyticus]